MFANHNRHPAIRPQLGMSMLLLCAAASASMAGPLRMRLDRFGAGTVVTPHSPTEELRVTIDGVELDLTEYAREHPGGASVLRRYHGRDATEAFRRVGHSKAAYKYLRKLGQTRGATTALEHEHEGATPVQKLFTHEDRGHVHKVSCACPRHPRVAAPASAPCR